MNSELDKQTKENIVREYQLHEQDTQSADLQVAILNERIHLLMEESRRLPFDRTVRMFLMKLVAKRRKLLLYLKNTDTARYDRLTARMGLAV